MVVVVVAPKGVRFIFQPLSWLCIGQERELTQPVAVSTLILVKGLFIPDNHSGLGTGTNATPHSRFTFLHR